MPPRTNPDSEAMNEAAAYITQPQALPPQVNSSQRARQREEEDTTFYMGEVNISPANTTHLPNVRPMLGLRRRRWANIGQTLGRLVV